MIENGRILPLKILVRELEPPKEKGHIIIPTAVIRNPTLAGEVVLVGDSTKNVEMVIKVGDKVLFSPGTFVKVTIDDKEYLLLDSQHVLFIWDEKKVV